MIIDAQTIGKYNSKYKYEHKIIKKVMQQISINR